MKLYYSPGACSLAPHIVLEEIGYIYDRELVSSMDGSTLLDSYLKINPKGRVPVLLDNEEVITEAPAIMIYLALTYPESGLLTNTPIGLTRSIEWMNWLSGIHASFVAQIWRTERFSDDARDYDRIQKKGMANLRDVYQQIETKLEGKKWAVEDQYSIVDAYLLVFFRWGNRMGFEMRKYVHWTRHAEEIERRPAVKNILKTEDISIWE